MLYKCFFFTCLEWIKWICIYTLLHHSNSLSLVVVIINYLSKTQKQKVTTHPRKSEVELQFGDATPYAAALSHPKGYGGIRVERLVLLQPAMGLKCIWIRKHGWIS